MAGFEPATSSLPRKCSTPELHRRVSFRAEDEAQTRDPQLGRLMLYQLSYFRIYVWAKMDSNHRRYKPADLQSAPFGHSGIRPYFGCFKVLFILRSIADFFGASCRIRTNDPEITNHVLWPTELKRRVFHLLYLAVSLKSDAKLQLFLISAKYFQKKIIFFARKDFYGSLLS